MTALYQLAAQYRALSALGAEELDEQTLLDTLDGLEGELTVKATNVAFYLRNLEAFAQTVEDAAKQLRTRAERIERRADAVRRYLLTNLQAAGVTKIEAPELTIAIRKYPARVVISDAGKIPADLYVYPEPPTPYPDKKAIAERLRKGEAVEGCYLEQSERLEIRA